MDISAIVDEIRRTGNGNPPDLTEKIRYVADNGKNTCRECAENDGKTFDIDDPDLPQLPIHPHCRCKYVSATVPQLDVTAEVERYRIVENLKNAHELEEGKANSLAEQIIDARRENSKLREQKLFLLFNGRYLMSSDGKLLLDAVSGEAVSEKAAVNQAVPGLISETIERKFDYSYARQGIPKKGGIPTGLYHIEAKEERSAATSPWSHIGKSNGWGRYAWTMHPDANNNMRDRKNFFLHGGSDFGSGGCIDLQKNDDIFQKYFTSTKLSGIYIYVNYDNEFATIQENKDRYYPIRPY